MTCKVFYESYYPANCDISKWGEGCEKCISIFNFNSYGMGMIILLAVITLFLFVIIYLFKKEGEKIGRTLAGLLKPL